MILSGPFWDHVLLLCAGAAAMAATESEPAASAPVRGFAPDIDLSDERDREAIRVRHGVRTLAKEEEGSPLRNLPKGVYGFTGAPATETPLFSKRAFRGFEVHKDKQGGEWLVGYFIPKHAEAVNAGSDVVEAELYPDKFGEATQLLAVSMARIIPNKRGPNRDDGCALKMEVRPK